MLKLIKYGEMDEKLYVDKMESVLHFFSMIVAYGLIFKITGILLSKELGMALY